MKAKGRHSPGASPFFVGLIGLPSAGRIGCEFVARQIVRRVDAVRNEPHRSCFRKVSGERYLVVTQNAIDAVRNLTASYELRRRAALDR